MADELRSRGYWCIHIMGHDRILRGTKPHTRSQNRNREWIVKQRNVAHVVVNTMRTWVDSSITRACEKDYLYCITTKGGAMCKKMWRGLM